MPQTSAPAKGVQTPTVKEDVALNRRPAQTSTAPILSHPGAEDTRPTHY